ncbi:MAG: gamma-glutamylcyclotransferase family protein [Thermodesulfobacteriota bacterium]
MSEEIKKLFVYGTLLQGEPRCNYLDNCKLIQIIDVPGTLYNSGRGYPAAIFEEDSDDTVRGELYSISANYEEKFSELDETEGIAAGFYQRKILTYGASSFYVYVAGEK